MCRGCVVQLSPVHTLHVLGQGLRHLGAAEAVAADELLLSLLQLPQGVAVDGLVQVLLHHVGDALRSSHCGGPGWCEGEGETGRHRE